MRFMIIVKASKDSEAGIMPSKELLVEMGKFNEALARAGVLLAGEGLQASSKGARVKFSGAKRTVTDGPFPETKELIAGFWMCSATQRRRRSSGSNVARIPMMERARSRFVRSLRRKTSGLSSLPSSESKNSGCAHK